MLEALFYYTGLTMWALGTLCALTLVSFLTYKSLKATVDVLSQYALLRAERKKPAEGVTFGLAWETSFGSAEWSRIWWRSKKTWRALRKRD